MVQLYFYGNNLEIIEKDLFEFNPNLEVIHLNINKILHIDPNVFNKLNDLMELYLDGNTCINMKAENDLAKVQKVIRIAKVWCTQTENDNSNDQFKAFKEDLRNKTEALDTRLDILEENVENFKTLALKKIQKTKNAVKDAHDDLMGTINNKTEQIEKKLQKIMKALKII